MALACGYTEARLFYGIWHLRADVSGRSANEDGVCAFVGYEGMLLFAEILEHLFGEGEGDGLRFTGLQGYFAECFELFHRSLHGRLLRCYVELHCPASPL